MKSLKPLFLVMVCVFSLTACNKKASSVFAGLDLFYDDFNRADGDLGSDWTTYVASGSLNISNQMAFFATGGSGLFQFATYNTALDASAYALSVTYTIDGGDLSTSNSPGLAVAANLDSTDIASASTFIICGLYGGDTISLFTSTEGSIGAGVTHFNITDGTTINVSLRNDGANGLTCSVSDGTQSESVTYTMVTPPVGTYVGFGGGSGSGGGDYIYGDDFIVTSLE